MKIGIDTFGCDHGRSGIGSYLRSLISKLPDDPAITYELFGSEIDRYTYSSGVNQVLYEGIRLPKNALAHNLWHSFTLNSFALKQKYDALLLVSPSQLLSFSFKLPTIVSVNDVISILLRETTDKIQAFQMKRGLTLAHKIIVSSQYIKKDLAALGIDKNKIEVIYCGIDHSVFYPRSDFTSDVVTIKPFAIKKPYFIYASRMSSPTKKHAELIRAFSLFKKKTGLPHRLVLAGNDGPASDAVHCEAAASQAGSDIFLTGFFPYQSLPELYACADAYIFPSISEGAGLPVLEAMAAGIPVACAKQCALPEIAGKNALFFDPDNIEETAAMLEQIAVDEDLRHRLIAEGENWAQGFSWEKTAEKTIQTVRQVMTAAR